ncbi:MAG: hypothetical protein K6U14_03675 [Firmicutes bacterium]|nr:hypothetical protein [Alicyclobacillaceae bacterium]MCL6496720.1 hypothetical protein [Bacillota bacterium]
MAQLEGLDPRDHQRVRPWLLAQDARGPQGRLRCWPSYEAAAADLMPYGLTVLWDARDPRRVAADVYRDVADLWPGLSPHSPSRNAPGRGR